MLKPTIFQIVFSNPMGSFPNGVDSFKPTKKESPMEYMVGFFIQLAGIFLLVKWSWSSVRWLVCRPLRFVYIQIKQALNTFPQRRQPVLLAHSTKPSFTFSICETPYQYASTSLDIPPYLRRQSSFTQKRKTTECTEFN